MKSNDELKEIDIKNINCYYFDDLVIVGDFDFENVLLDGKSFDDFLIYGISYKAFACAKSLHIIFNKVDGFIKVY